MPAHERFGLNDRVGIKGRGKPSIELEEEPAITVCEPDPAPQLAPQHDQLMSECCVLGFKPAPRVVLIAPLLDDELRFLQAVQDLLG